MADETDIKNAEEQKPNWIKPELYRPRPGTVLPGFKVEAAIDLFNPSKWQLKIMEGDKELYFREIRAGQYFDHYVEKDAIKPGTRFDVHVHYFLTVAWGQWASVKNLLMADPKPVIIEPAEGAFTSKRPRVAGRGISGATINLYQANIGDRIFGTAVVDANGDWQTTPVIDFFDGPFELVVNQTISDTEYWSENVKIIVADPKPVITEPAEGAVTSRRPLVAGRGIPDATINLYQANFGDRIFGTAVVDANGDWQTTPVIDFFDGPFELVVNQTISDTEYWSEIVGITVSTFKVSAPAITTPDNGEIVKTDKPVVHGRGLPGAVVKLYQANVVNIVFGTAYVGLNGSWRISPTVAFPKGQFSLTANQSLGSETSDWAEVVTFRVDV